MIYKKKRGGGFGGEFSLCVSVLSLSWQMRSVCSEPVLANALFGFKYKNGPEKIVFLPVPSCPCPAERPPALQETPLFLERFLMFVRSMAW
eukprot:COSAG06_NODE_1842_length_8236_cov_57.085904_4_plen_91_part_00